MAHRFRPAQGQADNKLGLRGRCSAIGSLRATFHHGPEPSAPHTRPEIRLQSNRAPLPSKGGQAKRSARRIRLTEESRYALLGCALTTREGKASSRAACWTRFASYESPRRQGHSEK